MAETLGQSTDLHALAERVKRYAGHIEDLHEDDRVLLLGLFTGAVDALEAKVRSYLADNHQGTFSWAMMIQFARDLGMPEGGEP